MSPVDYIIDVLLVVVIFRQTRTHQLTLRSGLLPLVLLAAAGALYLRPVPVAGNDNLALIVILAAAGAVLGAASGLADRLWVASAGQVLARAGFLSVVAWIIGMGFRLGFVWYAYHSGGPAIARFSASHHITGAQAWTSALFLMAAGQVIARIGLLQLRRVRAASRTTAGPSPSPSAEIAARVAAGERRAR